jgi:PAS domain S-box-containing protein
MKSAKAKLSDIEKHIIEMQLPACVINLKNGIAEIVSIGWKRDSETIQRLKIKSPEMSNSLSELIAHESLKKAINASGILSIETENEISIKAIIHRISESKTAVFINIKPNNEEKNLHTFFTIIVHNTLGILALNHTARELLLGVNDELPIRITLEELLGREFADSFDRFLVSHMRKDVSSIQIAKSNFQAEFLKIPEINSVQLNFYRNLGNSVEANPSNIANEKESFKVVQEQQAKIEAIFESGSIMFWTVNKNIALTSFNREYAKTVKQIYGEYPEINRDLFKPRKKFASDQYHEFWERKYSEVFNTRQRVFFQTKTTDNKGFTSYREIYLNPIFDTENKEMVKEVAGMAVDITEKKLAERRLNEQASKIRTIFDATNHMIWSIDLNYCITSYNHSYERIMTERTGIKPAVGQNTLEIAERIKKGYSKELLTLYGRVATGEKIVYEFRYIDRNQKEHIDEVSLNPIYNDEGDLSEIACLAQVVTYKRTAERKLKDQAARINAIFESTAIVIWTLDANMRIVSFNKVFSNEFFRLTGKDLGIGVNFLDAMSERLSEQGRTDLKEYIDFALGGQKQQFEGAIYTREGYKRWMEVFLNPINSDSDDIREVSCMCFEITEKKEIEEQMRESIREKEILLQEVHHRVKNNLQVISSILNLQSSYVRDENSLNILRESQNRIKSMSFIHESLYQTKDFSRVEFSSYILTLANNLIHSYSIERDKVKLRTNFNRVFLSLDQAIPCGLIANELVSNALKYAFPVGTEGEIVLSIAESEGKILFCIGDNGVGLPTGLDAENTESLGLQLVYTLIDQLDASIEVQREEGTNYLITFDKR